MSFLLNFVPSCGTFEHKLPPNTPTEEETTSLVEGFGGVKKGHCGKKLGGTHKTTIPPVLQWRPSLCTISEDDVVKEVGNRVMRRNVASKPNYVGYKNDLRQQDSFQDLPYVSPPLLF